MQQKTYLLSDCSKNIQHNAAYYLIYKSFKNESEVSDATHLRCTDGDHKQRGRYASALQLVKRQ